MHWVPRSSEWVIGIYWIKTQKEVLFRLYFSAGYGNFCYINLGKMEITSTSRRGLEFFFELYKFMESKVELLWTLGTVGLKSCWLYWKIFVSYHFASWSVKQNSRGGPQLVCYAEDSNGVKKPTAICWTNQSANWSNSKMKKKESKKKNCRNLGGWKCLVPNWENKWTWK